MVAPAHTPRGRGPLQPPCHSTQHHELRASDCGFVHGSIVHSDTGGLGVIRSDAKAQGSGETHRLMHPRVRWAACRSPRGRVCGTGVVVGRICVRPLNFIVTNTAALLLYRSVGSEWSRTHYASMELTAM